MFQNMFQNFLVSPPKSSASGPKYKPDTVEGDKDSDSRKNLSTDDEEHRYAASSLAAETTCGKITSSRIEAPRNSEEHEEDNPYRVSNEGQEKREDKTDLFNVKDKTQEYRDRELGRQLDLASGGAFKKVEMKDENDRVVPDGEKKRSALRSPRLDQLSTSARSKRASPSNSMFSGLISNADHHPVSEKTEKTDELWPDMSQINNSMTETFLESMFGRNSKELKEWKMRVNLT